MVDLDELIVPRHPDDKTWTDMIQRTDCDPDITAYGGRHLLYSLPPNKTETNHTGLHMLNRLERSDYIMKYPDRGKFISISNITKGLYTVHSAGSKTCVMPIEIGANHHYRNSPINDLKNTKWILDDNILKYSKILQQRVAETVKAINGKQLLSW